MNIEAMIGALETALVAAARDEGVELPAGAPEGRARAYLMRRVPTAFRFVVPPGTAMVVSLPPLAASERRGVALARAIGLFAGYQLCETRLEENYKMIRAARQLVKPLAAFGALEEQAMPAQAGIVAKSLENARSLLPLVSAMAEAPPGIANQVGVKRESALLTAVTSVLAPALEDREIAELLDDSDPNDEHDDLRKRTDRVYRRRKAAETWTSGNAEGFLVASFEPAAPADDEVCR